MFNIKNNCFSLIQKSCTPPYLKAKYFYKLLSIFILLSITLLLSSTSYANNNNDSCLTKDSNGNIIYNKNSNKKCILLRTIDSNTRNKLTNEGLESRKKLYL